MSIQYYDGTFGPEEELTDGFFEKVKKESREGKVKSVHFGL